MEPKKIPIYQEKELTKVDIIIEAIQDSIKIWEWLYKNPNKWKKDYPYFESMRKKYKSDCPLCIIFNCSDEDCTCPGNKPFPCFGDNYNNWTNGYHKKESAYNILKILKKSLIKYKKEQKKCKQTVTGN